MRDELEAESSAHTELTSLGPGAKDLIIPDLDAYLAIAAAVGTDGLHDPLCDSGPFVCPLHKGASGAHIHASPAKPATNVLQGLLEGSSYHCVKSPEIERDDAQAAVSACSHASAAEYTEIWVAVEERASNDLFFGADAT
ncbi:MAG: hypothetical protein A4E44_01651 [Methanosaeta sp. PtaB.Bin018]|nr:MAG: hypothetical protein A4E44_01651 [Methanosaeta sp. PtaB.Bin018]